MVTRLGIHYSQEDLTTWYSRAMGSAYPGWTRITNRKNSWLSNKAQDRYTDYYKGSLTSAVPQDQSGQYDPTTEGELIRDAAFYALVTSQSPTPAVVTTAHDIMRQVIVELLAITNTTYTYGGATIKAFDWLGTPQRWKLGGGSDVNPYFVIFGEWNIRLLFAWDYAKSQATEAETATFNAWIKGSGYIEQSTYETTNLEPAGVKRGLDSRFVSRTGPAGSYTIASGFASEELSGVDSKGKAAPYMHSGYKRSHVMARIYSNRHRVEAMGVGLIGIYLGYKPFIDSALRFLQEYFAYPIYPDLSYTDFHRSTDTDPATGQVKASKGYSYTIPVPIVMFSYALALTGDSSGFDFETVLGTTPAQSGSNGNSSDGVTVKGLLRHIKLLNQMHLGPVNRYSPTDGTSRIGAIDISGKENIEYLSYYLSNLYYQDSTLHTFITRTTPSNPQSNGSANPNNVGQLPDIMLMYSGYGLNPAVNRFPSLETTPKLPQLINVIIPADRSYVPGEKISITATAPGGSVTLSYVSGPYTLAGKVVTVTGAGTLVFKASQGGSSTYLPAPDVTFQVVIRKAEQALSFHAIPDQELPGNVDIVFSSTSGLTPIANSDNANLTKTDADTFLMVTAGTGSITVTQAGDSNYNAALPVTRTFTIAPVDEPTNNVPLMTEQTGVVTVGRLTYSGKPFYRFTTTWAVAAPFTVSGLLMNTGRQTGLPVFNNRLPNYTFQVRLDGSAVDAWTDWVSDDNTAGNDISRTQEVTNVIQVRRLVDGIDPARRVQSTEVFGRF